MPLAEDPQGCSLKFPTWLTFNLCGRLWIVTHRVGVSRRFLDGRGSWRDEPGDKGHGLAAVRAGRLGRQAGLAGRPRRRRGRGTGLGRRGDAGRRAGLTCDVGRRPLAAPPSLAGLAAGGVPAVLAAGAAVFLPRGGGGPGERGAALGAVPLLGAHRFAPAVTALRTASARCWWARIR